MLERAHQVQIDRRFSPRQLVAPQLTDAVFRGERALERRDRVEDEPVDGFPFPHQRRIGGAVHAADELMTGRFHDLRHTYATRSLTQKHRLRPTMETLAKQMMVFKDDFFHEIMCVRNLLD